MCQFHNSLSRAMCIQFLRFPSGFCRSMVVTIPVVRHLLVLVSLVSSGSSAFRDLTIAFLFVDRTPDFGLGLFTHAVMSSFGGCEFGALVVLPRKFIDLAFSMVSASGMS